MPNIYLDILKAAIQAGKMAPIKEIFDRADARLLADLNNAYERGYTSPLYWALRNREFYMFKYLVTHGMDVNKIVHNGLTPLHFATKFGCPEMVQRVLSAGGDPNLLCNGEVALKVAITGNPRLKSLVRILSPVTDLSLLSWTQDELEKLLKEAVAEHPWRCYTVHEYNVIIGNVRLLDYVLSHGADPNGSGDQDTPLVTACLMLNASNIEILLRYGASPDKYCSTELAYANHKINPLFSILFTRFRSRGYTREQKITCLKLILNANPDIPASSSLMVKSNCYGSQGYVGTKEQINAIHAAILTGEGNIVDLCVAAGFNLYGAKEVLDFMEGRTPGGICRMISPPSDHVREAIDYYDQNPRSLSYHAKFSIRKYLGHKDVECKIGTLPLPDPVLQMLKDIGLNQ